MKRDYTLAGRSTRLAVESGLAAAEWYHTDLPRAQMKALMQRSDGPAIRDTILWLGLLGASAAGGILLWGSWWCVPCWLVYGVLYGSATDSRWHECGHGTAFRTRWMNAVIYQIASFMIMRNPVTWRWSHAGHHTHTEIVGLDPEIAIMRPPNLVRFVGDIFGLFDVFQVALPTMIRNSAGIMSADEKVFIPASEWGKLRRVARIWLAIYVATIASAVALHSLIPLMLIGLPRLYGCWHMVLCGLLQHGALADNVIDHRLNSRTVYMNPVSRFIYWNMNYHVEHHLFPMVPYHALPRLHEAIKHDLPAPNRSVVDALREIVPVLLHQLRYEDVFIRRELPSTARPYREELHENLP